MKKLFLSSNLNVYFFYAAARPIFIALQKVKLIYIENFCFIEFQNRTLLKYCEANQFYTIISMENLRLIYDIIVKHKLKNKTHFGSQICQPFEGWMIFLEKYWKMVALRGLPKFNISATHKRATSFQPPKSHSFTPKPLILTHPSVPHQKLISSTHPSFPHQKPSVQQKKLFITSI